MKKIAIAAALATALPTLSHAAKTFDFKDPKGTNGVSLTIDAPLEPVVGWASDITGSCTLDPAHPEKTTGTIEVGADSVTFSHPGYTNAVRGYGLRSEKYPKIICKFKKRLNGTPISKTQYKGNVLVDFTIKEITKTLTVPIDIRYYPNQAYDRDSTNDGDLLVVRSKFKISRKAFGVAQEVPLQVCSDEVEIGVAVVGTAGVPRRKAPAPAPLEKKTDEAPQLALNIDGKLAPIAERMAFHKVRGCTVALVKNFEVQWVKHFGDTGSETKMPITEKTLFPAGQMSEPIAHAVALKLAEDKKIDLDADINTYLTRWKAPTSEKPVTIRQLLSNTAGFTEPKYMGYDPTKPIPSLIETLTDAQLAFTPGTSYRRAAQNINVLQVVLEDATKKSFPALVTDVFGPTESLYQAFPPSESYIRFAKGFEENGSATPHGGKAYPELAAAGLWTNASEYASFLKTLMACAAGKESGPWKKETAALAFSTVVPESGGKQGEGLTFGFDTYDKRRYFFRGGSTQGYYCQSWLIPEKGNAVVVFTNRQLAWQFTNELRDTFFDALTR